jgi:nucleoside-diphosphate-sugar epimerase
MKIVLPGGSGHVGTILAHAFSNDGHEVIVLSRNHKAQEAFLWRTVHWDGESLGAWVDELRGADAVINLAGRSVNIDTMLPMTSSPASSAVMNQMFPTAGDSASTLQWPGNELQMMPTLRTPGKSNSVRPW